MSIWSKIAKIGSMVAAPFTGGASLTAMPMIDAASKGLGAAAQSSASNRGTKAEIMMDQNSALEQQLLAREREKREAQGDAYKNAVRADMAQTWKPAARPANIPTISYGGGLSPEGLHAARLLGNQARTRLEAPDLQQGQGGMPSYRDLTKDKDFQKTMNPSIWEKIGGIASAALPLLGGALSAKAGGPSPITPTKSYAGIGPTMPGAPSSSAADKAALRARLFGDDPFSQMPAMGAGQTPLEQFPTNQNDIFEDQSGMDRWYQAIKGNRR